MPRSRYPSPQGSGASFSFGPGPLSSAMKALIGANVIVFFLQIVAGAAVTETFGLIPKLVLQRLWIWQLATYMFLHGGLMHILFNMLALWMFGAELERI